MRSIIKLIIACKNEPWIAYVNNMTRKYRTWPQKPSWYWYFTSLIDARNKTGFGITDIIGIGENGKIFDYPIKALLEDEVLSKGVLSKACLGYSNSEDYDKGLIRKLDLIAHYRTFQKKLPDPD